MRSIGRVLAGCLAAAAVLSGLALWVMVVARGSVALALEAEQAAPAPPRSAVLVGDLSSPLGVHVVTDKGIVVLLAALPDSTLVCTEVSMPAGGYGNCRSMKELRVKVPAPAKGAGSR